jgi:hypothetical protein
MWSKDMKTAVTTTLLQFSPLKGYTPFDGMAR